MMAILVYFSNESFDILSFKFLVFAFDIIMDVLAQKLHDIKNIHQFHSEFLSHIVLKSKQKKYR